MYQLRTLIKLKGEEPTPECDKCHISGIGVEGEGKGTIEHPKYAHIGMFGVFDMKSGASQPPNTKNTPRRARFRCSAAKWGGEGIKHEKRVRIDVFFMFVFARARGDVEDGRWKQKTTPWGRVFSFCHSSWEQGEKDDKHAKRTHQGHILHVRHEGQGGGDAEHTKRAPNGHVLCVRCEGQGKKTPNTKDTPPRRVFHVQLFMLEKRGQGAAKHKKHMTCHVFFISWDGKRGRDAAKHEERAWMDTLCVGLLVMGREVLGTRGMGGEPTNTKNMTRACFSCSWGRDTCCRGSVDRINIKKGQAHLIRPAFSLSVSPILSPLAFVVISSWVVSSHPCDVAWQWRLVGVVVVLFRVVAVFPRIVGGGRGVGWWGRAAGCRWWWCWWRIVGVTQMQVVWKKITWPYLVSWTKCITLFITLSLCSYLFN